MRRAGIYSLAVAMLLGTPGCWHAVKPLPAGLDYHSALLPAADVRFLSDNSFRDQHGAQRCEQRIFDEAFAMISRARHLVVVDMFLFNDSVGREANVQRRLCEELVSLLVARREALPELRIVVLTDPINTVYGGMVSPHFKRLEEAGIEFVETDLTRLRDSNPVWSTPWRLLARPWGNSTKGGWLPNPFAGPPVTLRSWLTALNLKANHRKVVIADDGPRWRALVTSGNPHDGSSAHSNVALQFSGDPVDELMRTEQAVLDFSAPPDCAPLPGASGSTTLDSGLLVQILTEEAIARVAEHLIDSAMPGDQIDIVTFYLADRPLVRALKRAKRRGVATRLILDPNRDAFGYKKYGAPNRQVAHELSRLGVEVRWAATNGEQLHTKMLLVRRADKRASLLLGSANFTRRNLRNYNLETNVRLEGPTQAAPLAEAGELVERLWCNHAGALRTLPYDAYSNGALWRILLYRLQEASGLSAW